MIRKQAVYYKENKIIVLDLLEEIMIGQKKLRENYCIVKNGKLELEAKVCNNLTDVMYLDKKKRDLIELNENLIKDENTIAEQLRIARGAVDTDSGDEERFNERLKDIKSVIDDYVILLENISKIETIF